MEVHHHTQAHAKKNWKTYFWEFLMLFLAVFCGFLAENFREHQVEHQREKQYIVSMLRELEADTAQLKIVLKDSVRVTGIDSMVRYINTNSFESLDTRWLYYFKRKYLSNVNFMSYSNNTLSQLKNAGNMRLIRKRNVVDSLNRLDNLIRESEEQADFVLSQFQHHALLGNEIFNEWFYLDSGIKIHVFNAELILNRPIAPPLLTKEQNQLIKYANAASGWGGLVSNYNRMLLINYNFSSQLINFLKKEYNIR